MVEIQCKYGKIDPRGVGNDIYGDPKVRTFVTSNRGSFDKLMTCDEVKNTAAELGCDANVVTNAEAVKEVCSVAIVAASPRKRR